MPLDLFTIPITRIDGVGQTLDVYRGQVLLFVNVASKCGLTPQYEGLEHLNRRFGAEGLAILGFPSNDFAGQEPGSDAEIQQFCMGNFGVSFPMFSKITVVGPDKHPLYAELIDRAPTSTGTGKQSFKQGLISYGIQPNDEPEVLWNFEKFIVSRKGEVVARFSPDTLPDSPEIVAVIESELGKG